jgi:hypothetical protein
MKARRGKNEKDRDSNMAECQGERERDRQLVMKAKRGTNEED